MDLQMFTTPDNQEIRAFFENDEPIFVAADVAKALGYRMASDMTRRIDDEDKGTRSVRTPSGEQEMTVIWEAGLYVAILGSQIPEAKGFKRWVTHDVLPALRKTGSYSVAPAFQVPKTLSEALRLAADQQDQIERQALQIEAAAPKVAFVDGFVEKSQTQPLRAVAKVLGVKEKDFVRVLIEKKVLYRLAGKLTPAQEHMEAGRFEIKEVQAARTDWAGPQMRFTTRGVEWAARKVREWGITNEKEGM